MPDLADAFTSAPYIYAMMDGSTVSFKRMLMEEWSSLTATLRAERMAEENILINKQVNEKDFEQRARVRFIAQEYVQSMTTFQKTLQYVTQDVDGIERLLKFSAVNVDWAVVGKKIPPIDKMLIADNIVHLPIVKSQNPSLPAGSKSQIATDGPKPAKSRRGKKSADSLNTSSTEIPASSPSAS